LLIVDLTTSSTLSHHTLALKHSMATLNAALTLGEGVRNSVDMPPGSDMVAPADLEASDVGSWQTTTTAPASPPASTERNEGYNGAVTHPLMTLPDELLLNVASHLSDQDLCNLCLTSKHLGAVAQEALYRSPAIVTA
jgi:hypothetical protein